MRSICSQRNVSFSLPIDLKKYIELFFVCQNCESKTHFSVVGFNAKVRQTFKNYSEPFQFQ